MAHLRQSYDYERVYSTADHLAHIRHSTTGEAPCGTAATTLLTSGWFLAHWCPTCRDARQVAITTILGG